MQFLGQTTTIYVTNQELAKHFYTEILGYDLVRDVQLTDKFRYVSICPPSHPEQEIGLFSCDDAGVGVSKETGKKMFELVEASAFSVGVIKTDNCVEVCENLRAQGVRVYADPVAKAWGVVEVIILDDSGNRIAITSPHTD
ncbi:MAG: VOC family protein [Pseudomonadota bacterium]